MEIFEFEEFQLNVAERRLTRNGKLLPLSSKPFDVLLLLVKNSGSLVTKNELLEKVWTDAIVEASNLAVTVFHIRKALNGNKKDRSLIQTISGRGYRLTAQVKAPNSFGSAQSVAAEFEKTEREASNSIAVLPFENAGANSDAEYLSDGITESLIHELSRLPELRVLARSAVFRYKNSEIDVRQIGRMLDAQAVLTGRVFKTSDRLIINLELVDAAQGVRIWGERFDRKLDEILGIEKEIVRAVSEKLKISGKNEELLNNRYTNNAEAYQYYLRGRHFWNKYSEAGLKKSIVYFQKAVDVDADYALAYAGLADSHFRLANIHVSPKTALPKSKAMALKAVKIDSNLAEAHISLGIIKCYYDHDWTGAEAAYRRAIEINPKLSLARQRYAAFLMLLNRLDEALAEFESCQELDPLSLQLGVGYATCLTIMGRYEQAISQLDKTIELEPNYYPAHTVLGWVYLHQGEHKKAAAILNESLRVEESPFALAYLGYSYAVSKQKKEADGILKQLQEDAARKYVSPYFLAVIHIGLNRTGKALDLLEQLFDEHSDWLIWFKIAPELNSLRPEPRFVEMLKRIKML